MIRGKERSALYAVNDYQRLGTLFDLKIICMAKKIQSLSISITAIESSVEKNRYDYSRRAPPQNTSCASTASAEKPGH